MIDWIGEYAKAWGRCTRWMQAKTDEGYPTKDTTAKAFEGGRETQLRQHFGEVRLGQSLAVQRVLLTPPLMPLDTRVCFEIHYVVNDKQRNKIDIAERILSRPIAASEYFRCLDRAHYHLAARIEPIS